MHRDILNTKMPHGVSSESEVLVSTGACILGQVGSLARSGTVMYNYVQLCEELYSLRPPHRHSKGVFAIA